MTKKKKKKNQSKKIKPSQKTKLKKIKSNPFQQELENSGVFREEPPNQWLLAKIRQNPPQATHYEYF